mmetsp:Transcript_108655/g.232108  ORF Transcript_108655/g.232108 Transcript_108655/m.232108 type:complete len:230 (-) Transcript_108655:118-807(-)
MIRPPRCFALENLRALQGVRLASDSALSQSQSGRPDRGRACSTHLQNLLLAPLDLLEGRTPFLITIGIEQIAAPCTHTCIPSSQGPVHGAGEEAVRPRCAPRKAEGRLGVALHCVRGATNPQVDEANRVIAQGHPRRGWRALCEGRSMHPGEYLDRGHTLLGAGGIPNLQASVAGRHEEAVILWEPSHGRNAAGVPLARLHGIPSRAASCIRAWHDHRTRRPRQVTKIQ